METYTISYDYEEIATLVITDRAKADPVIKEMVEFWTGSEDDLEEMDGDYTKAFCLRLAKELFCRGVPAKDDEGWAPFDGSYGIILKDARQPSFDEQEVEIEVS